MRIYVKPLTKTNERLSEPLTYASFLVQCWEDFHFY